MENCFLARTYGVRRFLGRNYGLPDPVPFFNTLWIFIGITKTSFSSNSLELTPFRANMALNMCSSPHMVEIHGFCLRSSHKLSPTDWTFPQYSWSYPQVLVVYQPLFCFYCSIFMASLRARSCSSACNIPGSAARRWH